jgi:hypothetical protein
LQPGFGSFHSGAQPGYAAACDKNSPVAILSISHMTPPVVWFDSPKRPTFLGNYPILKEAEN